MRAEYLIYIVLAVMVAAGVLLAENRYEFIVYPSYQAANIESLHFDFGKAREHPEGGLFLTNKNGNLPLTAGERALVESLLDVEIVGSDSIDVYLEENGWNAGGIE